MYKGMRLLLVGVLVLALLGAVAVGCGDDEPTATTGGGTATTGAAPTGDPVVIGAIVSATGPTSALGEQERNVLEMMEGVDQL